MALAGCEAWSPARSPETSPAAAAPLPPTIAARPPAPTGMAKPLDELPDAAPRGLAGPEVYPGTGRLASPPKGGGPRISILDDGRVTLNFVNADIREVIDVVLGETLNIGYLVDPKVQGTTTLRTSRPLPRSAVIPALESALAMNGVALVLSGDIYKVVPLQEAASAPHTPAVSASARRPERGFGIQIVPLRFASATALREVLQPFVPKGRILKADPARNLLIFSGTGVEARELLTMIDVFDVDWMAGMSFALIPIETTEVKNLVNDLEVVFGKGSDNPLAGVVRFSPIERLNAVLVISPQAAYLEQAQTWVERLDRGEDTDEPRIYVYHVENGRAEDLAVVLSQLFESGPAAGEFRPEPALAPGLSPATLRRSAVTPQPAPQYGQEAGTGPAGAGAAS